jgi:uncharacterized membrane protein YedE/YeeE
MPSILSAFASGLIFGLGLIVSQMVNPAKVRAFLDIFGNWDPSLALVMAGAVAVSSRGYMVATRRGAPVLAPRLEIPTRRRLDAPLVAGAVVFGIGWGLVGLCPGPALVTLAFGLPQAVVFVTAMLAGMALFQVMPSSWQQMNFRQRAAEVEG